jgi:hypothetical protein
MNKKKDQRVFSEWQKENQREKESVEWDLGGAGASFWIRLKDWPLAMNRRNNLSKKNALNFLSLVHFLCKFFLLEKGYFLLSTF